MCIEVSFLERDIRIDNVVIFVMVSVGIYIINECCKDFIILLNKVDKLMYSVKEKYKMV